MKKRRGKNEMKRCALSILIILALVELSPAYAQKSRVSKSFLSDAIRHRSESANSPRQFKSHTRSYKGYEISVAFPRYTLKSNIPQLDKLSMRFIGANLGVMLASHFSKVKATVGYYESEPSVHYDMNMIQGALSAGIYPLRFLKEKAHLLEPYTSAGISYQLTRYSGTYLPNLDTKSNNNSVETLLGKTGITQLDLGLGIEYQMASHNLVFIHLFAEINYNIPISWTASNTAFSGTIPISPTTFKLGINFGIIK